MLQSGPCTLSKEEMYYQFGMSPENHLDSDIKKKKTQAKKNLCVIWVHLNVILIILYMLLYIEGALDNKEKDQRYMYAQFLF